MLLAYTFALGLYALGPYIWPILFVCTLGDTKLIVRSLDLKFSKLIRAGAFLKKKLGLIEKKKWNLWIFDFVKCDGWELFFV